MKTDFDLIGVGIGPFHLSLAALMSPVTELRTKFFEQGEKFKWHSEIMFPDSVMQTSFLKDLVTPVDPTNPHSFLNYLVSHGQFYAHLNTGKSQVSRKEFELYCQWVAKNLEKELVFNCAVKEVSFQKNHFHVHMSDTSYTAKNLSIATGAKPWVPEFAEVFQSETCFHAKSNSLAKVDLKDKRVVIIGGGQTGLEVFRNVINGKWGRAFSSTLISSRQTLVPLDESPFTNEYFTPSYASQFWGVERKNKEAIVNYQRFASDGNTPFYLQEFYNELYHRKYVEKDFSPIHLLPQRRLTSIDKINGVYHLGIQNNFHEVKEEFKADVVIFCTGVRTAIPHCLDGMKDLLVLDQQGKFSLGQNFNIDWKHSDTNTIYALNFGRYSHGIAEPQMSLMAWRSGTIINHLLGKETYPGVKSIPNFTQHGVQF